MKGLTWVAGTPKSPTGDAQFKDDQGRIVTLPLNKWTHVALTRKVENGNQVFRLYLDGELRGSVTATGTPVDLNAVFVGGRPIGENGFRGQFSCLRISRGARSADELLSAATERKNTVAYWPLDAQGDDILWETPHSTLITFR